MHRKAGHAIGVAVGVFAVPVLGYLLVRSAVDLDRIMIFDQPGPYGMPPDSTSGSLVAAAALAGAAVIAGLLAGTWRLSPLAPLLAGLALTGFGLFGVLAVPWNTWRNYWFGRPARPLVPDPACQPRWLRPRRAFRSLPAHPISVLAAAACRGRGDRRAGSCLVGLPGRRGDSRVAAARGRPGLGARANRHVAGRCSFRFGRPAAAGARAPQSVSYGAYLLLGGMLVVSAALPWRWRRPGATPTPDPAPAISEAV